MYRQGDVSLVPVDKIPQDAWPVPLKDDMIILALGEITGHAHVMMTKTAQEWQTVLGLRFLDVRIETPLVHPDHQPAITVAPGIYLVTPQAEYDPTVEVRRVTD